MTLDANGNFDLMIVGASDDVTNVNLPMVQVSAKIGNLASLSPSAATLVAAINAIYAANWVTAARIATSVAGDGLYGGGGSPLAVGVDNVTLQIVSDALQLMANSILPAHLSANLLGTPNQIWGPLNNTVLPGVDFDGASQWAVPAALSFVANDPLNPTGGTTCVDDPTGGINAGKNVWLPKHGIAIGSIYQVALSVRGTTGDQWRLDLRPFDSGNSGAGAQVTGTTITMDGTVQTISCPITVPAGTPNPTAYIRVFPQRMSGSGVLNIYTWRATTGAYLPAFATPMPNDPSVQRGAQNLATDATWQYIRPGLDWSSAVTGGRRVRWHNPDALSLTIGDVANPVGAGNTLNISTAQASGGVYEYLDEMSISNAGKDALNVYMYVSVASGTGRVGLRFYDSGDNALEAGQHTGPVVTFTGNPQWISLEGVPIPATAYYAKIYAIRATGAAVIKVYQLTITTSPISPTGIASSKPTFAVAEVVKTRGEYFGRHFLRDTRAQLAKIRQGVSGEQLSIAFVGDSWVDNLLIWSPLRARLTATIANGGAGLGDAGVGYVAASSNMALPAVTISGVVTARTSAGSWSLRDNGDTPVGYGPDIGSTYSTDIATPASKTFTSYLTDATIYYLFQPNGGSFRWRVDAGAWTTVNTVNASIALGTVAVPSQTAGSHTISIEVTVAGTAGVELLGVDMRIMGSNGVRLSKLGNGGGTAGQYASAAANVWQNAFTTLAPNLILLLLGTNDDSADILPSTFYSSVATIIDRLRAARSLVDIMIVTPGNNNLAVGSYAQSDYEAQLRQLAMDKGCALVDAYLSLPDYQIATSRNLTADPVGGPYTNNAHLSSNGGALVADLIYRMIQP